MAKPPEEALHQYLQGLAGLNTLVGNRIRTGAAAVKDQRPFVVIEPPNVLPEQHTTGSTGLATSRIPIHCEGTSYKEAREIATLIFDTFKNGWDKTTKMSGLSVRYASPRVRGKSPNVVGGNDVNFHSIEIELNLVHVV